MYTWQKTCFKNSISILINNWMVIFTSETIFTLLSKSCDTLRMIFNDGQRSYGVLPNAAKDVFGFWRAIVSTFGTGISTCLLFVTSCHQGLSPFSLFLSHLRKRNENPERRAFFSLEGSSEKYNQVRTFTLVEYFGSPSANGLHHSFSGLTT